MDLALNNLQYLICHKTKPKQTKSSFSLIFNSSTMISKLLGTVRSAPITLQLVLPSTYYSFLVLWQSLSISLFFRFLLF